MGAAIRIYVVNLDRSAERLASIERQLERLGLSFARIAAVDGRSGAIEEELAAGRASLADAGDQHLTREEIGCYLSHLKTFDAILAAGHAAAIVLEDDVNLSRDFSSAARGLFERFSNQSVIVKLEPWKKARLGIAAGSFGSFNLVFARHPLTETGAYFITANAIREVRASLGLVRCSFDNALYAQQRTCLDLFTLNPPVAQQAHAFESLIEPNRRSARDRCREHVLKRELLRPAQQLIQFTALLRAIVGGYGWSLLFRLRRHSIVWPSARTTHDVASQTACARLLESVPQYEGLAR
jgi:glycosyl transferase family 25